MIRIYIFDHLEQLDHLKDEIATARRNLEQAWATSGNTDPAVLAAGEIFDRLMNEYERLTKNSGTLTSNRS